jgi:hypothetical protein
MESVLLGTEWAVRRLDLQANEIWSQPAAVAWSVNISQNGGSRSPRCRTARSAGTACGTAKRSFSSRGNRRDWMAWMPDGYDGSSVSGDNYVGWH